MLVGNERTLSQPNDLGASEQFATETEESDAYCSDLESEHSPRKRGRQLLLCSTLLLLLIGGCFVVLGYWASIGMNVAAALSPATLPIPAAPEPRRDACPCECEQGENDMVMSLAQPDSCREGDNCMFGRGWCSMKVPLAAAVSEPLLGKCWKQRCGGPLSSTAMASTCTRNYQQPFDVTAFVREFPTMVKQQLNDAQNVNKLLATVLEGQGLHGVNVDFDEALIHDLSVHIDHMSVEWLTGCWPASRYAVISGGLRLPDGSFSARLDGFELEVFPVGFGVRFTDLRVELSCPGATFAIDGFGDGSANIGALTQNVFSTEGDITFQIRGGWGLFRSLSSSYVRTASILPRIPSAIVFLLGLAHGYELGGWCSPLFRNVFQTLPYTDKQCCEDTYQVDHAGCLIGGQFNGKFMPGQTWAVGVECNLSDTSETYYGRCSSIPGSYFQESPGRCHETDESHHVQRPSRSRDGTTTAKIALSDVRQLLHAELIIIVALGVSMVSLALLLIATAALIRHCCCANQSDYE